MATGTGVGATILTALKAHLAAVAIGATVVVAGGTAAAAVATGAIHPPAQASAAHADKTPGAQATQAAANGATARASACDKNGDATRMASVYANMFQSGAGGKSAEQTAHADICALFAGTDGHAVGFGEVRQALDITAAVEASMASKHSDMATASACLAADPATGKPANAGTGAASGQPSFTAPTADEATTLGIIKSIFDKVSHGTPLEQLARACGVASAPGTAGDASGGTTGNGAGGSDSGGDHGKPTGTPGARPTGTPGAGHP